MPFRGQCLVHRAEILQLSGAWTEALDEVGRAYEELSRPPPHPALGDALYRLAELQRLGGGLERPRTPTGGRASTAGIRSPGWPCCGWRRGGPTWPAAIRRALEEPAHGTGRAQLLAAHIEIALVAGDVPGARRSAEELVAFAGELDTPLARACRARLWAPSCSPRTTRRAALAVLRPAWAALARPRGALRGARVRALVAAACRRLGDEDGAALELEAAAATFGQLGASRDLAAALRQGEVAARPPLGRPAA